MMSSSSFTTAMMLLNDRRQYIRYLRAQRQSLTVDMVMVSVVPLVNSLFNDTTNVKAMEDASLLIPLIYTVIWIMHPRLPW